MATALMSLPKDKALAGNKPLKTKAVTDEHHKKWLAYIQCMSYAGAQNTHPYSFPEWFFNVAEPGFYPVETVYGKPLNRPRTAFTQFGDLD